MRLALRYALADGVPGRSLRVALVVGVVLNLINQGDALLAGVQPVWWKLVLTFCVPFCVASYGSYSALVSAAPDGNNAPPC